MNISEQVQMDLVVAPTISITVIVDWVDNQAVFAFKGIGVAENGVLVCIGTEPVILSFTANKGRHIQAVRFCPVPTAADDPWPIMAGRSAGPGLCPQEADMDEFRFVGLTGSDRTASLWDRNCDGSQRYAYALNFIVTRDGQEHPVQCDPRIINRAN